MNKKVDFFYFFILFCLQAAHAEYISFQEGKGISKNELLAFACQDFKVQASSVSKWTHAEIIIQLKKNESHAPNYYRWTCVTSDSLHITFVLEASHENYLAYGLYGLLQDQLKVYFFHPKQTILPDSLIWPSQAGWMYSSTARFNKRGFHIHTQHPLELTPYLLDEKQGFRGQMEVMEYIDWLVRNGQNYFQFKLLESVVLEKWVHYFNPIAQYAQKKGVLLGIDISLHQRQQKAFKLYKKFPFSWKSVDVQIAQNLKVLTQIPWSYANVDFKEHEYAKSQSPWLLDKKRKVYEAFTSAGVKLMEHHHIVNNTSINQDIDSNQIGFLRNIGQNFHTVMFYSLQDSFAPVYENKDFSHIYKPLCAHAQEPETWFFPESAYWCTFDNSVPMFLSSYLNARLKDILVCDSLGVQAHVTFSSGWEWSYAWIDYSIARWAWDNGQAEDPYQYLYLLTNNENTKREMKRWMDLQDLILKKKNLISYLTAMSPTDELPPYIFNREFQPRPKKSYKYLQNESSLTEIDSVQTKVVLPLMQFYKQSMLIFDKINIEDTFGQEWLLSMKMTALRAKYRAEVLSYVLNFRKSKILKDKNIQKQGLIYISQADKTIAEAQEVVGHMEKRYRYSLTYTARKHQSLTAYDFGYLYPVSELHFWRREQQQALRNNYSPFFMNIWDMLKISGVKN